jgi:hypothetical protein
MVPFDLSTLDRSLFTTHEQGIVQYLVSLADIANNMEDTDSETLGWFHRGYQVYPPEPWDARNQESVYTLAWFYTYDAAWNPYYLDPVLRDHVYAAMRYYLKIQGAEGWWPSDSWTDKNRAATGFALVYLGEAAVMMEGVGWDAAVRAEVLASLQRGAEYMLDPSVADVWDVGMRFSNQIIGSMTGIASYKHLMPAHIETAYQERLDFLVANCQSPATCTRTGPSTPTTPCTPRCGTSPSLSSAPPMTGTGRWRSPTSTGAATTSSGSPTAPAGR